MNDDPAFKYLVACLINAHVEHRRKINRIAMACAYLTKKGIFRRVRRGVYEAVQKAKP